MPPGGPHFQPPPGGPVVIDVGGADGKKVIIGAVVAGVLGLVAVVAGAVGAVDGGTGTAVVVIVVGCLFLLPALLTVAFSRKIFRARHLVLEPAGIRWDDPHGAPWAVPWHELAAVQISKHTLRPFHETVGERVVTAASNRVGERAHVRIDLYPADPGFAGRHPEMAHLWQRQGVQNGYRLPLGANVAFIPQIANAMGMFAPQIYRGVHATAGRMPIN